MKARVSRYGLRVTVRGGHLVHAARSLGAGPARLTACHQYVGADLGHHWRPAATAVTCRCCAAVVRKEALR